MPGYSKARLVVLINNKLNYTQIRQFEEDDLSCIWLKINLRKRNHLYVCCLYRQWNLPTSMNKPNSGNIHNQIDRFKRALNPMDNLCNRRHEVFISGDLNVDQLVKNNPPRRWDLRKLNDCLDEYRA